MAKQEAIIPLTGTIGNLNFYKKDGEYRVRRKGGVNKNRILNDPKFARTRENMAQLGLVASDLKLFLESISKFRNRMSGKVKVNPLSKLFFKVAYLDGLSQRGDKKIAIGIKEPRGIAYFRGLPLTNHSVMQNLNVSLNVDRTTGIVSSEEFIPATQMVYPPSATHFEMQSAVVAVDFEGKEHKISYSEPLILPIDQNPLTLSFDQVTIPDPGGDPTYFVLLSLIYHQHDNGDLYQLNSENCLTLDILDAFNL